MDPKIKTRRWGDPHFEDLSAEGKLAILWLDTNPRCDLCGVTRVSIRRFEFETSTEYKHLQGACEALKLEFMDLGDGTFWSRNYIGDQMGRGEKLINNCVGISMAKTLATHPEKIRRLITAHYPEAVAMLAKLGKKHPEKNKPAGAGGRPTASPPEGEGRGKEKEKEQEKAQATPAPSGKNYVQPNPKLALALLWINTIRPAWKLTPNLTAVEQRDLLHIAGDIAALGQDVRQMLNRYAAHPDSAGDWALKSRSRFLSHYTEVVTRADEWREKTTAPTPATRNARKVTVI